MNCYLDIKLISSTDRNKANDIKGVVRIVHAIQSKSISIGGNIKLSLDFPEMKNEENSSKFGELIRVFGTRESIAALATNGNIESMYECGQIEISTILNIPSHITQYAILKRDRRYERAISGKKGAALPKLKPCFLSLKSSENKRRFSINLVRTTTSDPQGDKHSTYGFSHKGSTVPTF